MEPEYSDQLVPECQEPPTKISVLRLEEESTEYVQVERLFRSSLPSSTIVAISRVDCPWLMESYEWHRQRISVKNRGIVNEKYLFHGTSCNDPRLIYESEFGFDFRRSKGGRWGHATYFSEDASYSNRYAHCTGDYKQILLAKVLTGVAYASPPNKSLKMPPSKRDESSSMNWHYDSVVGVSSNSIIYMVYDNLKAYPSYVIKYTCTP